MGEYAAAYTKGFQYQGAERNATKYLTALLTLVKKRFGLFFCDAIFAKSNNENRTFTKTGSGQP